MDLGTPFLVDVVGVDAVEPRRPLQEGVADAACRYDQATHIKVAEDGERYRIRGRTVTEYVPVLDKPAPSLLTLFVGDNTAF
ncbi:hypothetical protein [Nitrosospira sp. Is2]|uniref:hypothetical protein n=1 Tax=Nitrosospira sp. Is2 TaxID=3080532 RepID=UPI002954F108|nr:hypothetical protein [Nitrosospira sp. Is2]WON72883.1 hypothetical protein R5L00_10290 [Nitrosospira sp. Is2]